MTRAAPLRAIILYKTVKGALQLTLGALLAVGALTGFAQDLAELGTFVRRHMTLAWAVNLAEWLVDAHHLLLVALALGLDGALTSVEAWALHKNRWWGPWLVVVASGSLLPYELLEIVRRPRVSRVLLFVANALIVGYLARHAKRHRAAREEAERAG
jgi:uncharacterized membrane protein (DUF2068 family)